MKILFVIPARGGSKGFPGKNLACLAGIPLVGHVVSTACQASLSHAGSRVVCSTDDPAIADAARRWGAEVPFSRPAVLATDSAQSIDVVKHALLALGGQFDAVALLQPTSPLTESEDILGSLNLFQETGAPVVSICQAEHPLEWYFDMDSKGRLLKIMSGSGGASAAASPTFLSTQRSGLRGLPFSDSAKRILDFRNPGVSHAV